jgi:hypothetical protein
MNEGTHMLLKYEKILLLLIAVVIVPVYIGLAVNLTNQSYLPIIFNSDLTWTPYPTEEPPPPPPTYTPTATMTPYPTEEPSPPDPTYTPTSTITQTQPTW